jgi:hypothetical protein
MVEGIQKLLCQTTLGSKDEDVPVKPIKAAQHTVHEHHESFLEELARKECRAFPCRYHRGDAEQQGNVNNDLAVDLTGTIINAGGDNDEANDEHEDDHVLEDRRHFHLLKWSSDEGEEDFDSDDYLTDEDGGNVDDLQRNESDDESSFTDDDLNSFHDDDQPHDLGNEAANQPIGWEDRTSMSAMQPVQEQHLPAHMNHPITSLLVGLANSENEPLIRADIDWQGITSCPDLSSFYPAAELQDLFGAKLLQGTLRMDPPLGAIQKILDDFPKSCLDMSGFFAACQFANPKTSRKPRTGRNRKFHPLLLKSQNKRSRLNPSGGDGLDEIDVANDDEGYSSDDSDVGEVVKLVMNRTICARKNNNIEWGMVAFLGDARTSAAHTKELLMHNPEALIDTKHGAFGVSPLDRMISGNFIHGDTKAWAEKLRLALRAASFVRLTLEQKQEKGEEDDGSDKPVNKEITLPKGFFAPYSQFLRTVNSFLTLNDMNTLTQKQPRDLSLQSFYPYHELIRLLMSPSFGGTKFGDAGFLNTLDACTNSDPNAFLRPDNEGNLPLHVALSSECNTALGIKGERRLIRYLLSLDKDSALCPENNGAGRLPLRMSIDNGWPVYDIIIGAALSCDDTAGFKRAQDARDVTYRFKDHIKQIMVNNRPLLHDALNGGYHPRFGIHGARQLVKNIMSIVAGSQQSQSCLQACLRALVDSSGRTALHVALENKWPVHDIIIQASPLSLETPDPTRHGLFPFQIAACAFTHKSGKDSPRGNGARKVEETDDDEEELIEGSILFELIRENPLCVTWGGTEGRIRSPSKLWSGHQNPFYLPKDESKIKTTSTSVLWLASNEEEARSQAERKRRMSTRS